MDCYIELNQIFISSILKESSSRIIYFIFTYLFKNWYSLKIPHSKEAVTISRAVFRYGINEKCRCSRGGKISLPENSRVARNDKTEEIVVVREGEDETRRGRRRTWKTWKACFNVSTDVVQSYF